MNRKVPINWSVLRDRLGTCASCGMQEHFKDYIQHCFPFPYIQCKHCYQELSLVGAMKDFFKEKTS